MPEPLHTIGDAERVAAPPTPGPHDQVRGVVLRQLVRALVDLAGAIDGSYVTVDERGVLEAIAAVGGAAAGDLPESVLRHVRLTRRTLVLDAANLPDTFSCDAYFARRRHRAIVCVPAICGDDLVGLVYLENDLVPRPLGREQIEALELLAAQTAQIAHGDDVYADIRRKDAEQRRMHAELVASRDRLQAILDNMVDAVFVVDAMARATLVNESAVQLLGPGSREANRQPVDQLAAALRPRHPDGRPFTTDELPTVRALRGEIIRSIDLTVTDSRTERDVHLRVNAAPVQDENGAIVGAVIAANNVTEAVELDRMRDEFLRVASHELKTPVAIVKGYADIFRRITSVAAPEQSRMLAALVRGADRIDRIVSDLLFLQQLRSGHVELVLEDQLDLVELAHVAARRLEPDTVAQRTRIRAAGPVVVRGDRQLLSQVLGVLLDNALRYSPRGSPVEIALEVPDLGATPEREAIVSVIDHGVGIALQRQARIFEPFYRAHTDTRYDTGGMGAGLYLAKAIVLRHGGTISFVSEEGSGSSFTFRLPLGGASAVA